MGPRGSVVKKLYPSLFRETSAGILGIIARVDQPASEEEVEEGGEDVEKKFKKIPVQLDLAFADDCLYCEWAYVIDLDKEVFEVYGGDEHKHKDHQLVDVGPEEAPVPAYICSYNFSKLYLMEDPKEFIEKIQLALAEAKKARQAADGVDQAEEGEGSDASEEKGEEMEVSSQGNPGVMMG